MHYSAIRPLCVVIELAGRYVDVRVDARPSAAVTVGRAWTAREVSAEPGIDDGRACLGWRTALGCALAGAWWWELGMRETMGERDVVTKMAGALPNKARTRRAG